MEIKKIAVLGTGIMGSGIVQVLAIAGKEVVMRGRGIGDPNLEKPKAAMLKAQGKLVEKGKKTQEEVDAMMSKITFTSNLADCADCDLVIESAVEEIEEKIALFQELDKVCKSETIYATNTSSYPVSKIAAATTRPDRFMGIHFFNPATVMKLVEVVRAINVTDEIADACFQLMVDIGKTPIKVGEGPGFVVNRILVPLVNEGAFVLEEGLATAEDIDTAMKLGANHPMGPLALGDLIGLDTILSIMEAYHAETGDQKYRPSRLLKRMVRGGKLGRKTGEGFFKY